MLPEKFKAFDGTGRPPRQLQEQVLNWVWENRHKEYLAIQAPTGVGKSAIIKAIQNVSRGHIIVPSNSLLDQYQETYTAANFVKGKEHYVCKTNNMFCVDVKDVGIDCKDCILTSCKARAAEGEPTTFNPISKFYFEMQFDEENPAPEMRTALVDEAHRLLDTLELLISDECAHSRYHYPEGLQLQTVGPWLDKVAKDREMLADAFKHEPRKSLKHRLRALSLRRLKARIWNSPDDFCMYETTKEVKKKSERYLCIRPINVPRSILKSCLGDAKQTILLSATLPKYKAREIFGTDNFAYLDVPSPIPVEQRKIIADYRGFNSKTPAREIADWIREMVSQHGGPTIVHTTYGMGRELSYYLPDAIFHTGAHDKDDALKRFRQHGGIWLAAGCAEGIDLPGDQCRLNLIPVLPYANVGDPVVDARIRRYGHAQYERQTIMTLMQQVGRSTRGETDHSTTVCGDGGRLAKLIAKHKKEIPESFWRAIEW